MKSAENDRPGPAPATIIESGSGPRINGTRITVYTIVEYLLGAWSKQRIAGLLNLSEEQVQAAIDYIEANDLEVLREYVSILERIRQGNPPELQARLDARHVQFQALLQEIHAIEARAKAEIHDLIQKYRESPVEEAAHAGPRAGQ